mmetsp:Transcript_15743/g.34408  ORF Transcript_15743/g.34408 Transcript_15743/m.34408 type:complete len:249 (-) Transcript_15743:1398-2144(-)
MLPRLHGCCPLTRVPFQRQNLPKRHDGPPYVHLQERGESPPLREDRSHGLAAKPRRRRSEKKGPPRLWRLARITGRGRQARAQPGQQPQQGREAEPSGLRRAHELARGHGVPNAALGHPLQMLLFGTVRSGCCSVRLRPSFASEFGPARDASGAAAMDFRAAEKSPAGSPFFLVSTSAVRPRRLFGGLWEQHRAAAAAGHQESRGAAKVPQLASGCCQNGAEVPRGARTAWSRRAPDRALHGQGQPDG